MDLISPSMLVATVLYLAIFGASAQQKPPPTTTTTSTVSTFTVEVGKGDHAFRPDVVQAEVGDIIQFDFYPLNHSVVRAAYHYPCVPYEKIFPGDIGFFSGFEPVDAVLPDPPSWSVRINNSEPIFFYCSAPGSCMDWQMVGVINPNSTQLLSTQKLFAANASYMLQPGDSFPDESGPADGQTTTRAVSSQTAGATNQPSLATSESTTHAANTDDPANFPPGAIAGVVVGVVVILALAAALFFLIGRHHNNKNLGTDSVPTYGVDGPMFPTVEPVMSHNSMAYIPQPLQNNLMSPTYSIYDTSTAASNPSYSTPVEMDSAPEKVSTSLYSNPVEMDSITKK